MGFLTYQPVYHSFCSIKFKCLCNPHICHHPNWSFFAISFQFQLKVMISFECVWHTYTPIKVHSREAAVISCIWGCLTRLSSSFPGTHRIKRMNCRKFKHLCMQLKSTYVQIFCYIQEEFKKNEKCWIRSFFCLYNFIINRLI